MLTEHERAVLKALAEGKSQAEIAQERSVSFQRVNNIVASARRKTDARTVVQLVVLADRNGWLA